MNRPLIMFGFTARGTAISKSQINRCHVSNMQSPVGPIFGFNLGSPILATITNNNITNCVAENITHLPGGTGTANLPYAAGIGVAGKDQVLLGCVANNITSTDAAVGEAYGIRLSTNTDSAIIANNRVIKCTSPNLAANTSGGIFDASVLQNSTYENNYAEFNGRLGNVNFIPATLTPGTPIQDWIVPGFPAAQVAGKLDNINRRNP